MEGIQLIIALALIIAGCLNIALFIKIWEMTNDVRELKFFIFENMSKRDADSQTKSASNNTSEKEVDKKNKLSWQPKFRTGGIVIYKYSKKTVRIHKALITPYEYLCENPETGEVLSTPFKENELVKL